jgi:hypothetical protein
MAFESAMAEVQMYLQLNTLLDFAEWLQLDIVGTLHISAATYFILSSLGMVQPPPD